MATSTKNQVDTQGQRRVKYGVNVAIAIIVAVAIAVLINWISYNNFRTGGTRWDLTSTRQYSLSPLTRKVLDRFDSEFRIVTLLDAADDSREDTQRARDLVEEYARASDKVKVEHINPATEIEKRQAFEKSLHARFAERFKGLDDVVTRGAAHVDAAKGQLLAQANIIAEILKDKTLKENDPRRAALFQTQRFFESQAEAIGKLAETLRGYKSVAMPNHSAALQSLKETIESLDVNFYPSVLKSRVNPLIEDAQTPAMVKDGLLLLSDRVVKAMAARKPLLAELSQTRGVLEYDVLLTRLSQPNPVVILTEMSATAINLSELFRAASQAPDPENKQNTQLLEEKQFLGEERLTGVLARMTVSQLNPPPMVVFVAIGTGRGGRPKRDYLQLMDRLRSMGLQVEVWEPVRTSPFAQPGAKLDVAPTPAAGQRAVWVLLPGDPPDPQNPNAEKTVQTAIDLIRARLGQGDGLLAIVAPEVLPAALSKSVLDEWKLSVSTQHVVLREVVNRYGQNKPISEHDIRVWPQDLPVSKAIGEAGMIGMFTWASPINVMVKEDAATKYYPLVTLTGQTLWGNLNTADEARAGKTVQLDPAGDLTQDEYTIALAAEKPPAGERPGQKLVVIADQLFATDTFGAAEYPDPVTKKVRQMTPFPGNHELFVNSVYWLAGLDELIAASARSQDVRRIGRLSTGQMSALQWTLLLGMPLGTFVIGMGVWMTRRS